MPRFYLSTPMALLISMYALGLVSGQTIIHVPGSAATIQAGILMASTGDIIQVGSGTFTEPTIDFGGKAITVRGDPAGTTVVGTILFVTGESSYSRLESISLKNGGSEVIRCTNASPTISDCEVSGQMMNEGISCVAVLASGDTEPGSLSVNASPTFIDCRFLANTTSGAATAAVDLMAVSHLGSAFCAAVFSGCLFQSNSGGSAGAVRAHAQTPLLATALNTPLFIGCTFGWNSSLGGLAGAIALSAHGVFAATSSTIANCVMHGNHGSSSGALALLPVNGNGGVLAKIIHCSFSDNAALTSGNGGVLAASGSTLTVWNSILRGSGLEIASAAPPFSLVNVNASNIEGSYAGSGNIDTDPHWVDAANGDLHLHAGSPCIDGGDGTAPFLPLTDIDNQTRDPATADMGADEAFLVGTFEDFVQTSIINGAGPLSQQEKSISEGDLLTLYAQTPNGTFFGGVPIIAAQFWGPTYTNGIRPSSPGGYPELHVNPFGGFILKAGGSLGPIPYGFSAPIPAGANLVGLNCRIQSIVVDPTATNQQFAASHTLELTIQ